jgi:hypothetical protein
MDVLEAMRDFGSGALKARGGDAGSYSSTQPRQRRMQGAVENFCRKLFLETGPQTALFPAGPERQRFRKSSHFSTTYGTGSPDHLGAAPETIEIMGFITGH